MICDSLLLVSGTVSGNTVTGQTVTGTNISVLSTDKIDLLQNRDIGEGEVIYMRSQVITAVAGATSIAIEAVVADDAALSTNLTVIDSTGAIPLASLTAGARFGLRLNPRLASLGRRYLGARYTIVGTGTAGAFFTDFGIELQDQKSYPSSIAVI
jgi:predicted RecA/RadA family phage recombinase